MAGKRPKRGVQFIALSTPSRRLLAVKLEMGLSSNASEIHADASGRMQLDCRADRVKRRKC